MRTVEKALGNRADICHSEPCDEQQKKTTGAETDKG
jgi:hypothetical protein